MKQFTITFVLSFLILSSSQAQHGWRSFNQFGPIMQIHQSANHSLWIMGPYGIWHLPDSTWQQVPHASAFVFEDNNGAIWTAGSDSQGLWRYDDHGWQQQTQVTGIVNSIYQEADGTLWVGGVDTVWYYDQVDWQPLAGFTGLVHSIVRRLDGSLWLGTEDADQPWWVGTFKPSSEEGGLWRYDDTGWHQHPQISINIENLYETKDGTLWIGGWGNGFWRHDDNGLQSVAGFTDWVTPIYQDSNGTPWMGGDHGLCWYDGSNWQLVAEVTGFSEGFYEDADGTLWVGGDGIWYYDGNNWQKEHEVPGGAWNIQKDQYGTFWAGNAELWRYDDSGWQPVDGVSGGIASIYQDTDGTLWAGGDYLWRYEAGSWQQSIEVSGSIHSIYQDTDGTLWVGGEKGLWRHNADGWQQQTQVTDFVNSIYQEADGTLWAGGDNGLWRHQAGSWQQSIEVSGSIHSIYQDTDGTLWVGGLDVIWRYDASDWQQQPLNTGMVMVIYRSSDGSLWAGGSSLWRYEAGDWQQQLLNTGMIMVINEDAKGALWLGGEKGLWRRSSIGPDEVWFHFDQANYNKQIGLPDSWVSAIHPRPDGTLWFGSWMSGLFEYRPGPHAPDIRILSVDGDSSLLPGYVTGRPTLAVEWVADDMETLTEYIRYQYKIDNQQWVSTPIRQINTPFLTDGQHIFSVRAFDYDGMSSRVATFDFAVDTVPPSVLIAKPVPNQVVGDRVEILGSVLDDDLSQFKVEYRSLVTDAFQPIASGDQPQISSILAKWETRDLPDGDYQIQVIATDQLGHSKEHQVDITLDNTPPVVSLQTPQADQKLSGGLKITAQVNDLHLYQYQLKYTQDLPLTAKSEWESIQTSAETLSASPAQIDDTWNSVAVFGPTLIRMLVQDQAGNQQTVDVIVDLANQTAKPGVRITQPQAQQVIKEILSIVGTVEEYGYSIIDNYQLSFGRGQNPRQWTSIHRGSNAVNDNVLGSWDTRQQKDGLYTLRLLAINGKGYQNSQQITVTLDNTPPTALISRPDQNKEWIDGQQVEIRGTATDDNFQQYLLEYAEVSNLGSWNIIKTTSIQAVDQNTLQFWQTIGLNDGRYQLRLTVIDQAGNSISDTQPLTLDNQKPKVEIIAPAEKTVVSGSIQITGIIKDDNLKDYQLEVQSVTSPTDWKSIGSGDSKAALQEKLGQWNTQQVKDGSYRLRLTATDQTGQPSSFPRLVTVDNTPPQAEITAPRKDDQVGPVVILSGTASDANFKSYRVEFGEGDSPTDWLKTTPRPTTSPVEDGELLQWLAGKRSGVYSLRLTVEDQVEQQRQAQVRFSITSLTEKTTGGDVRSADGEVTLYLPPNSLQKDTIITVNRIPSSAITWPLGSSWQPLDLVYQLVADPLQLNRIKPATLTISYGGASLRPGQQPMIFRQIDDSQQWQLIGGVVNTSQQTVRTAIHQLGRYGVMEMAPVQTDSSAQLLEDSLTCQPRVFSPISRRGPNTETTISFQLDKSAKVSIKVYNVAGGLVNWLTEEQTFSEGKVALPWDGRDHHGQVVPTGLYIVAVAVGGETQTKVVNVWNH